MSKVLGLSHVMVHFVEDQAKFVVVVEVQTLALLFLRFFMLS